MDLTIEEALDGLMIVLDKSSPPKTGSVVATDTSETEKVRISWLNHVGKQIGKVIKLDYLSQYACKGKYVKFCIELDLTKPLLPMVCIEGKSTRTVVESITVCGKAPMTPNAPVITQQSTLIKEDDYGSWMTRQRHNQRAGLRTGNNNRFATLHIDDGSNQSVQRSSNPDNSRKNFGEAGAKNGNPTSQIASIATRDVVTSIKEGGSSRATNKRAQNKNKAQRKSSKTAMKSRAIIKCDPKSKGATSISNLSPLRFADTSKGITKLFVFGYEGNNVVSNDFINCQMIEAPTKGKSCEVQEVVIWNAGLEVVISHHGKAIVEQQEPQTNKIEMITQGKEISKDQLQIKDTVMADAGSNTIES
ncbi:hypothetical protein SLEP1_g3136 [Rubroshorea leprosula]|uniref:Uncharacterized protein n=1 Tax=Rubroshorea leprosula TaxID=152421 RepID=A0AAV5HJC6_9ROSI|nr:hypothetical protein SLEP1_g3136 [Rubroshorea leprosula]